VFYPRGSVSRNEFLSGKGCALDIPPKTSGIWKPEAGMECRWTVCLNITAALHYFTDALGTTVTKKTLASGSWLLASNANKIHVTSRITV